MGNLKPKKQIALAVFILITIPLIINGFPILNMDSSINIVAYNNITSLLSPPPARPIFYSLYFFITSIGKTSIFFPCLIQDAVITFLLFSIFKESGAKQKYLYFLSLIYLPISYLAILSNTIMTDIWFGISYLSAYIVLSDPRVFPRNFFLLFLIAISTLFAPANGFIVLASAILTYLIMFFLKRKIRPAGLLFVFLSVVFGIFTVSLDDYVAYNVLSPITDSNTFWVGRLIGDHLAQPSIQKLCSDLRYKDTVACQNKNQYIDRGGQEFLWGSYKYNFSPWNLDNQSFFGAVKDRSLEEHPLKFFFDVIHGGVITMYTLPHNMNQLYGSYNTLSNLNWVYVTVKKYFNYHQMMNAWQQASSNSFSYFICSNFFMFILIIYALLSNLKQILKLNRDIVFAIIFSFICIIINALVDGGLSMINARYNVKGLGVILLLLCFIISSLPRRSNSPESLPEEMVT